MTSRLFAGLVVVGAALSINAQSVLSLNYPGGLPVRANCGMALSMGGTGIGVLQEHHVMMSNPANLGFIDKTVFSTLVSMNFLNLHDGAAVNNFLEVMPEQVTFGFWLGKAGTIALSLDSRTDQRIQYLATYPIPEIEGVNTSTGSTLEMAYSSNGGIKAWQAGWGYNVLNRAYVGASYERVYYSLDQSRMQTTHGVSGTVRSNDSTYVQWRGNAIRLGVSVPVQNVVLGMTGEYFIKSDANQTSGIYWGNGALADSNETTFELQFPPSLGFGLSYKPRPEWLVAFDVSAVVWSSFQGGGVLQAPEIGRTYGLALGTQFVPAPDLLSPRYWETIRYRAGIRYNELPVTTNREIAFSFGAGLPLQANGLLDIVVEYGWRTDQRYTEYGEEFLHIGVGVNAGRKWAKSSRESY